MTIKLRTLRNYKGKARQKVLASKACELKTSEPKTPDSKATEPKTSDTKGHTPKSRDPKGLDPWKYAAVPVRYCGDLDALHVRLESIAAESISYLQPSCRAVQETEADASFAEFSGAKEPEESRRLRAEAIDAYFNLRRETGKMYSPIDVFVENGQLVLRLALHVVIRNKKPIALRERGQQIKSALMANKAGKTNRQLCAEAAKQAREESQEMPQLVPYIERAVHGIAQAISNLSDRCESGNGTAMIGGVRLPVRVELFSLSQGKRPKKGALNVKLYSQRPEVRNKLSTHYNVSHAYLGTAIVPYLSDIMAKLGLSAMCINFMMDKNGAFSPHLQNTVIHELLHTFALQDLYRRKGQKVHPDVADDDIMYTIGTHARIHDYAFNKIFVMAKRLKL